MVGRLLRQYLPPTPAGRTLALVALVDSSGTGFYLAGSVVFFLRFVGLTTAQVGAGLTITGAVALACTVPLGIACDRWGARRLLVVFQSWRALWFVVLAFTDSWALFVVVCVALGLVERAVYPANQAVVAASVPDDARLRTMAAIRTARNVGFSLGAAMTAPLLATADALAYQAVVLANAVSFVATAWLLARRVTGADAPVKQSGLRALPGFRDRPYLVLAGANAVLLSHTTVLAVAVPLWTVSSTRAPVALAPVLLLVNTVMAVVLQVPLSRGCEGTQGALRTVGLAVVAMVGSCGLFALAAVPSAAPVASAVMVGALVLLTLGELWQSTGAWELSLSFAPETTRTQHLSVFSLGGGVQDIVGPLFVTGVVVAGGPAGWAWLAGAVIVAGLITRAAARRLAARDSERRLQCV